MSWLQALDYIGTFTFALTGASKAVKRELDLFGVLVLATATGLGGGIIRDAMLSRGPSAALEHNLYFCLTISAGALIFFGPRRFADGRTVAVWGDALGLGTFTAIACMKAEQAGLPLLGYPIIAAITACGGGVIRDVLVRDVPLVIKADFYASACMIGALFFVAMQHLGMSNDVQMISCVVLVTSLRLLAVYTKFELPKVRSTSMGSSE